MERLHRATDVFGLSVLTASALGFLAVALVSLAYPFDLDIYEGCMFAPAWAMANGRPAYGAEAILAPPYVFTNYGPLMYAILAIGMKLFGVVFWPGRLLSIVASVGTAGSIFAVARCLGSSRGALVGAGVFLAMPTTWTFGTIQRVDALGVALAFGAVALVVVGDKRPTFLLLAGAASALAFFTKQSLVAGAAAIVFTMLRSGRRTGFLTYAAGAVAAGLVVTSGLLATGNNVAGFLFTQSMNAGAGFSLRNCVVACRELARSPTVVGTLGLATLGLVFVGRRGKGREAVIVPYALLSGLAACAVASRVGSSANHFHEVAAVLALLAGIGWGVVEQEPGSNLAATSVRCGLLLAIVFDLGLFRIGFIRGRYVVPQAKRPLHERVLRDLQRCVPAGEPVGSEYGDLVLRAGRALAYSDWGMYQVGPRLLREKLDAALRDRTLAAYVTIGEAPPPPGYVRVPGYGFRDSRSLTGLYYPGPMLYLREDLLSRCR